MYEQIVHERTLLGAIDSYMSALVHVQPFLARAYREQLEALAERWLEQANPNAVELVSAEWLAGYLAALDDSTVARQAIGHFYSWAFSHGLVDTPLDISTV